MRSRIILNFGAGWLFFFGVFDYGLKMPFPKGMVLEWLPASVANMMPAIFG